MTMTRHHHHHHHHDLKNHHPRDNLHGVATARMNDGGERVTVKTMTEYNRIRLSTMELMPRLMKHRKQPQWFKKTMISTSSYL